MKPLVLVTWMDACSRTTGVLSTGEKIEEKTLGCTQNTVGYLLHKTENWIVLAADWGAEENQYRDFFEIPRSLVKKIRRLK